RRQPDLIIDAILFYYKGCTFLKLGQNTAADIEILRQIGLKTRDLFIFFVYPHHACCFAEEFQHALRVLVIEIGVWLEIENDHVPSMKALASRLDQARRSQQLCN